MLANAAYTLNQPNAEIKAPFFGNEFVDRSELTKTEVYRRNFKIADLEDYLSLPTIAGEGLAALVFFCGGRKRKYFSDKDKVTAAYFGGHVYRAANMAHQRDIERACSLALKRRVHQSVIVLSKNGYVISGKDEGLNMLRQACLARLAKRRLTFINRKVQSGFEAALRTITATNQQEATFTINQSLQASLIRIPDADRNDQNRPPSEAQLILLLNPFDDTLSSKHQRRLNAPLTSSEADIVNDLRAGYSLREISERRQTSYGTTRWHMKAIYQKFGVRSQIALLHAVQKLRD